MFCNRSVAVNVLLPPAQAPLSVEPLSIVCLRLESTCGASAVTAMVSLPLPLAIVSVPSVSVAVLEIDAEALAEAVT